MTDANQLIKLRDLLLNEFTEDEVIALCRDLDLDYGSLPGTGFFGKTRGLLEVAQREGRLRQLQARLRELRPDAFGGAVGAPPWPGPSSDEDVPVRPIGGARPTRPTRPAPAPIADQVDEVSRETGGGLFGLRSIPLLPLLGVGLLALICVLLFFALRPATPAAPTVATVPLATSAPLPTLAPTSPPVAGQEIAPTPLPVISSPVAPAPVAASPTPRAAEGVVVVATPAPVAVTAVPGSQPAEPGVSHPAALAFRDINARLPGFYRGEVDASQMQQEWMGRAYTSLAAFSNTTLPRALRLGNAPRNTMDISYRYVSEPSLIRETNGQFTVRSREYWRYANPASGVTRCDTRDYTYVMTEQNGRYVVLSFGSALVRSGCE
jgi:Effector-associated domain 7